MSVSEIEIKDTRAPTPPSPPMDDTTPLDQRSMLLAAALMLVSGAHPKPPPPPPTRLRTIRHQPKVKPQAQPSSKQFHQKPMRVMQPRK
jgi:hypothetical protein